MSKKRIEYVGDGLIIEYEIPLRQKISDLEAKLAEKEDRINWLVEAEFNRKWAKKYVEMRRKEDPMLCLPDSDEVYEKYFELKQQLTQKDKQLEKLKSENHALISDNAYQEADMFEFNSRIEQLQKQLAEKEHTINTLIEDHKASQEWYKKQLAESEEFLVATKWKVQDLNKQLADTEAQNKRLLEKLDIIVRSNQELEQKVAELTHQHEDKGE